MLFRAALQRRPPVPPGPYVVVGLGRAGMAAAAALADLPGRPVVRACDEVAAPWRNDALERLRAKGVAVEVPGDGVDLVANGGGTGCVVKSPGVPFHLPVIARALEAGVPVIDELELGWRLSRAPVIGVTGTNGKSTVSTLLAAAIGAETVVGNTDFGPPLSASAPSAHGPLVCEVSSYQLEGCPELVPEAAVLTNLRSDHLHRHGGFDGYVAAKRKLFVRDGRSVALAVVNADDDLCRGTGAEVRQRGGRVLSFGRARDADFRLTDCGWTVSSGWLEANTPDGRRRIEHRLPGVHNAENVLAAVAAGRGLGLEWERILAAVGQTAGVPGRFEAIDAGQPFDAVVDFAHTPDAIEAVVDTARELVRPRGGRVLVVVSVAGQRPPELTAPIGVAAAQLADRVIATVGSLRSGSPATTVEPLFAAARSAGRAAVEMIGDRRLAIRAALEEAREGDLLLVLGRGARPRLSRDLSGTGVAFDDRVVLREELVRLLGEG